jgi:hypothetical protein
MRMRPALLFPRLMIILVMLGVLPGGVPAFAQTSSALVKDNPAEQYKAVKATMQQFYNSGFLPSNIKFSRKGEYDMGNCGESSEFLGEFERQNRPDQNLGNLVDLAITIVTWESDLRTLGVPENVWGPVLTGYENTALAQGGTLREDQTFAAHDRLLAALNGYRQQSNRTLPKFVIRGGCGSGEVQVHISLMPPDGQLFLIPVFLYKLCQAQNLNPSDPRACDRWTEVLNGAAAYVAGDYVYMARWADGSVRCGPLGFTSANMDGKEFSITKMRSSECKAGW